VTSVVGSRPSIRFRGRSFLAFVLLPEPPIGDWLVELDAWLERSPGFFARRPVMLDASSLEASKADLEAFLVELGKRDIRIMGIEGVEESILDLAMPPLVSGGREAEDIDPLKEREGSKRPAKPGAPTKKPTSLLVENPVRSGQSLTHPHGDVVVLGSVASGAEVMAGGSIHVYGALRGRAIAGSSGNARARIFCRKLEAELLAINGFYRTSDDMDESLRGQPIQAWLEGETVMIAAQN
jgi:septum site-determining protein MinC